MTRQSRLALLIPVTAALGAGVGLLPPADGAGIVGLCLAAIVIFFVSRLNRQIAEPLWVAFILRTIMAVTHNFFRTLPDSQGDAIWFQEQGASLAQHGIGYILTHIQTGARLYVWVIGLLDALFLPSQLLIQSINVLFGALIVLVVYRIAAEVWDDRKVAVHTAWITALFPSLILYSSITMREVAVAYPLALSVLHLIRWYRNGRWKFLWRGLLVLAISTAFHSGVFIVFGTVALLAFSRSKEIANRRGRITAIVSTVVVCALVVALGNSGWLLAKLDTSVTSYSIAHLRQAQAYAARGRVAYLSYLQPSSLVEVILQTPIRIVYFLFAPFIWMSLLPKDLMALFDAMLYILIAVGAYLSRKKILRNPSALVVTLVVLSLLVVFANFTSNYGTALRHRSKIAPLTFTLLVVRPVTCGTKSKFRSSEHS